MTFDHFVIYVDHALIVVNADNVGDVREKSLDIQCQHASGDNNNDNATHMTGDPITARVIKNVELPILPIITDPVFVVLDQLLRPFS